MGKKKTSNHRPNNGGSSPDPGIMLHQAGSALIDYPLILSLVFGGCCANVWSYEQLLIMNPQIGSALTFSQMIFITVHSLPNFLTFPPPPNSNSHSEGGGQKAASWFPFYYGIPRLKPRQVPLSQWASQVIVHTTGSLLNNWAFAFNVPLTVLIVFRSAGLAVSMFLGFVVLGRRYSFLQVLSVLVVSSGAILATLSKTSSSAGSTNKTGHTGEPDPDIQRYTIGIAMVVTSLLLTGVLGVLQEKTYRKYGPCWKEGVFYTHLLSLPVFLFLAQDVKQGLSSLNRSRSYLPGGTTDPGAATASTALVSWLILGGNLVTQLLLWDFANDPFLSLLCLSLVICFICPPSLSLPLRPYVPPLRPNRVSSVSTNLVLTSRKAISLCISVWWFASGWNAQFAIGAGMVFLGSLLFSLGGSSGSSGGGSMEVKAKANGERASMNGEEAQLNGGKKGNRVGNGFNHGGTSGSGSGSDVSSEREEHEQKQTREGNDGKAKNGLRLRNGTVPGDHGDGRA
ncbi:hypothetical protein D9757_013194 [Collybiopsis confluens]|uniref:Uncharacterized protein n=1 Tax=Collybiopsis confluens TaxID=2823264 RepID=A0A8H5FUK0_9AGAR|nr:hypothetical protein D9757_013194 [Collybiopsis confluens]